MTDEQILQTMKSLLEPMQKDLSELKSDVSGLKGDVSGLKRDMSELKQRVTKIEVIQENHTNKRLDLLMEYHQETAQKLQRLDILEETLYQVKSDTEVIKSVVTEHSKSIKELKAVK